MSGLRGILIAFAVLLLAAIYGWGRRNSKQRRASEALQPPASAPGAFKVAALPSASGRAASTEIPAERLQPVSVVVAGASGSREPAECNESAAAGAEPASVAMEDSVAPLQEPGDCGPSHAHKIIALRLVATVPRFSGAHLRTALEAESLHFGKYQIFHRITDQGDIAFSVAGMLEPGSFDLDQMFHEQYPGIALFAQLPGAWDGVTMLSELISCARRLQQSLGGLLQDERGMPLMAARIEELRREVRDFEAAQSRARSVSSLS